MRAVIRIFQSQKLVDQFVRFRDGEHLVALYSGFAGGCGDSVGYQFRGLSPALCFQAVQNLFEQFLNRDAVQIGRNSADAVFPAAEGRNLKAKLFKYLHLLF